MLKIAILLINDSIVNTLINCVLVVISQGGNLFLNMIICIILAENALKLHKYGSVLSYRSRYCIIIWHEFIISSIFDIHYIPAS